MDSTKKIKIKDFENEFYFTINLFDAEKGLDFIDNTIGRMRGVLSIKPYIDDLLPLADLTDPTGKVVKQGMTRQDCLAMFKNPLSIIELCTEIFKFQEVFLKDSATFQPLINTVKGIWNTKVSESQTSSETLSLTK